MLEARSILGRLLSLGIAIGAHAAVVVALLAYEPSRAAMRELASMMVRMIVPEPVKVEPPKPEPPKVVSPPPRPQPAPQVKKPPPPPLPVLTVPETVPTPTTFEVPSQPAPVVLPPIDAPPSPPAAVVPESVAAVAPPPPPPPIEPPRFDADYLSNPPPAYPDRSRRIGEEGRVQVRVLVGESGQPVKVELRNSSGFDRLDQAALAAVRQWRFVPAKQGDRSVAGWVIVPLVFRLGS